MCDFISRKDLLEIAEQQGHVTVNDILSSQTIDTATVRHGRWEDGCATCPICGEDKFTGLDADIWADWKPKYCPNCGAKMDGELDE